MSVQKLYMSVYIIRLMQIQLYAFDYTKKIKFFIIFLCLHLQNIIFKRFYYPNSQKMKLLKYFLMLISKIKTNIDLEFTIKQSF